MATAINTNNTYIHFLEQAKLDFWNRNAHLSDEQRQTLWQAAYHAFNPNTHPSEVPRSMASASHTTPGMTQTATPDLNSMDRTISAPPAVTTARATTSQFINDSSRGAIPRRSLSSLHSQWPSSNEESNNAYGLYPDSNTPRKQQTSQAVHETPSTNTNGMVEYEPDDYVTHCIPHSTSPSTSFPPTPNSNRLQVSPLTTTPQWSPSLDGSISPSTPPTALMTPVTMSSSSMSRQGSFNPQYFDELPMLRVHSDSSTAFSILPEDGFPISMFDVHSKPISSCVDTSLFFGFTGPANESFLSPTHVSSSASALAPFQNNKLCLVEDMRRSASSSSENEASDAPASSVSSRPSRREREVKAHASRKIAPRVVDYDETKSASSNVQMKRLVSEDGSSKDVTPITKAPYIRPQHPKIRCQHCDERPEGFRGTHELERHVARAHAPVRKAFICVDASVDSKFLANCKHCRNKKEYGAYYNAAAHLRRAHFHPRKRGRKGKYEKRGGIGGGDDPPMDYLKQNWIKEIEVDNKPSHPITSEDSPAGSSASDQDNMSSNAESADYEAMETTYSQPTDDTSNPNMIEYSQYVGSGAFVNSNDGSYDSLMQCSDPNSADINNFQFDAYMMPQ